MPGDEEDDLLLPERVCSISLNTMHVTIVVLTSKGAWSSIGNQIRDWCCLWN